MFSDVAGLVSGLVLLVLGGRAVLAGASKLASTLGVSELVIGLTVVAFGTSLPELAVSVLAAISGDPSIAFGNVVGSNVANIGLVIGLCALVRPLQFESVIVSREIPMMLLATMAALILGLDRIRGAVEVYDRSDGLMLMLIFCVFLYYSISEVIARRRADVLARAAVDAVPGSHLAVAGRSGLVIAIGLVVLLVGAELTVSRAVSLAEAFGVPNVVIGLTLVAVGTSLPEVVTCLVATWKGQTSLAVGNVVGSNIFNLLFVLGTTSVIQPVAVPAAGGAADLLVLVVLTAVMLPLARLQGAPMLRWQGVWLVVAYLGYVSWRILGPPG